MEAQNRAGAFSVPAGARVGGRSAGSPCTRRGRAASGRGLVAGKTFSSKSTTAPGLSYTYTTTSKDQHAYSPAAPAPKKPASPTTPTATSPAKPGPRPRPLGYDGQYTNADTGLIYLRAREYDPATAQFLSVDSKVEETNAVYEYAKDDPLTNSDPTGTEPLGAAIFGAQELAILGKGYRELAGYFYLGQAALEIGLRRLGRRSALRRESTQTIY